MRIAWMIPCLLVAQLACAQELEPRAYSPNPVGMNFAVEDFYGGSRREQDPVATLPLERGRNDAHRR